MTTEAAAKKDTQKLQRAIVDGLEDVKAQDIQVFDTGHLSPLFERVIVASGTSNRQTKALAASVRDAVQEAGFAKPRTEGEANGEWIIVDCGAAVVHVMQPAIRQYYHLEEIWGDTPVRLKLGATRPLGAVSGGAPAKKAVTAKPATSLRRASAAKTAIREAEQAAKAEKAQKPAARRAPARKAAAVPADLAIGAGSSDAGGVNGTASKKTAPRKPAPKRAVVKKTARPAASAGGPAPAGRAAPATPAGTASSAVGASAGGPAASPARPRRALSGAAARPAAKKASRKTPPRNA